jgi:hypothetical protein
MSDTTPLTETPAAATQPEETPKKPNVIVRGFRKAKANPKQTLAVAGGMVLVGAAAALGRSTAPTYVFTDCVVEVEDPETESDDTTVD